jgi:hypothetical protein
VAYSTVQQRVNRQHASNDQIGKRSQQSIVKQLLLELALTTLEVLHRVVFVLCEARVTQQVDMTNSAMWNPHQP